MLRHQLVVRDVHQQILFLERLDDLGQHGRDHFERGRRDGCHGHEDAGREVVGVDVVREGAHLFDPDRAVVAEFHADGSDRGRGGVAVVGGRGEGGVLLEHGGGGIGLEGHEFATDW